jgi:hypothetical protein
MRLAAGDVVGSSSGSSSPASSGKALQDRKSEIRLQGSAGYPPGGDRRLAGLWRWSTDHPGADAEEEGHGPKPAAEQRLVLTDPPGFRGSRRAYPIAGPASYSAKGRMPRPGSCAGLGRPSIRRPPLPSRDLAPGSHWRRFGSLICKAISECFSDACRTHSYAFYVKSVVPPQSGVRLSGALSRGM